MSLLKRKRLLLAGVGVVAALGAGYLVFRWREDHGHRPAYGDIPTWLTFAAAVLGIPFALYQLRMQRRQLAEQQQAIAEEFARQSRRDELLDAQLAQVRATNHALLRRQAEKVDLTADIWEPRTGAKDAYGDEICGPAQHVARITNNSARPIRGVSAKLTNPTGGPDHPAVRVGIYKRGIHPDQLWLDPKAGSAVGLLRPGEQCGFAFDALVSGHAASFSAEFTDDAGTRWRVGPDLHLEQLEADGEAG